MKTLRPYQEEAVRWLRGMESCILADEMGLGKTLSCIRSIKNQQPTLILCPKSLKQNWKRELESEGITNVKVLEGRRAAFEFPTKGEVVIMNYDIIPQDHALLGCPSNMLLICDEVHALKNPRLKRSGTMHRLSRLTKALQGKVIGVTGTPLLTSPYDLYGILFAIDLLSSTYGNFNKFAKEFQAVKGQWGLKWIGPRNSDSIAPLKRVVLRRKRADVAKEIPLKTYEEYEVEIPTSLHIGIKTTEVEVDEEILINRMKMQLSTWRKDVELAKAEASIDFLKQLIENIPIVVFADHKETVSLISSALGIPSITGDTSSNERQHLVTEFQQGKLSGIVGTIGAMGVGLTLTHAHQLVMISRSWTPALNSQAEDRVCRLGQNVGVVITDIVSDSRIDKMIHNNLKRKQFLINEIVEA